MLARSHVFASLLLCALVCVGASCSRSRGGDTKLVPKGPPARRLATYAASLHAQALRPLLTPVDIDNDGDVDLLSMSWPPTLLLQQNGNFVKSQIPLPKGIKPPSSVAINDVDGNGYPDLVFGTEDKPLRLLLNLGKGVFRDASQRMPKMDTLVPRQTHIVILTDLNADGAPDLIVGDLGFSSMVWGYTSVHMNDGKGSFLGQEIRVGHSRLMSAATADFDGDGHVDILLGYGASCAGVCGRGAEPELHLGDSSGSFTKFNPLDEWLYTQRLHVRDFDGDGDQDIIAAGYIWHSSFYRHARLSRLWLNDGKARFKRSALPDHKTTVEFAQDIDGDGDVDLLAYDGKKRVWWLNDGRGRFTVSTKIDAFSGVRIEAFTDFDLDGRIDLIGDEILYGDGRGNFDARTFGALRSMAEPRLVDLDHDGLMDIVDQRQAKLAWNDGTGRFHFLQTTLCQQERGPVH